VIFLSIAITAEAVKFKKGPYLIYPDNNQEMTVLWQLDGKQKCNLAWGEAATEYKLHN